MPGRLFAEECPMTTKERILALLENNKGRYVSSHLLTEETGIYRSAVWKAVCELREEGYAIESQPRNGYRLSEDSDRISLQGIAVYLKDRSLLDRAVVFDELASTNRMAKLNVVSGMTDKTVIIARRQTNGAGHGGTDYNSPEGGIYLSLIREPRKGERRLTAADIGRKVAAVIEAETQQETCLDEATNRIYIEKKKVCGILTETIADLETGEISAYIIGIGIQIDGTRKNRVIAALIQTFIGEEPEQGGVPA